MNKQMPYLVSAFAAIGACAVLVFSLPGIGVQEWIIIAVSLLVVSAPPYFFYIKEIKSLLRSVNEKTVAFDRASSEVKRLKVELEKSTTRDEITDLHNMDHFMVLLNHERALTERADYKFTLAVIEIDQHFEIIRSFGNAQSDEFLKLAARVITTALREVDHIARIDNGRFVMTLSGASEEDSIMVMNRVSKMVCQIKIEEEGGEDFVITTSSGLTSYHGTESTEQLMENANKAIEHAIEQGRDRVAGYMFDKDTPAEA